jgi:hypothetical protein
MHVFFDDHGLYEAKSDRLSTGRQLQTRLGPGFYRSVVVVDKARRI